MFAPLKTPSFVGLEFFLFRRASSYFHRQPGPSCQGKCRLFYIISTHHYIPLYMHQPCTVYFKYHDNTLWASQVGFIVAFVSIRLLLCCPKQWWNLLHSILDSMEGRRLTCPSILKDSVSFDQIISFHRPMCRRWRRVVLALPGRLSHWVSRRRGLLTHITNATRRPSMP